MSTQAYGLMLHHFKGGPHPDGQGAITSDQLADMIEFMGPKNFLDPYRWTEKAIAGRLEAQDRCITLDDALLCQYDIATPVMESFGLRAFWFVYSGPFEGKTERLELYRHFRSVRYLAIDDFYADFFKHLEESTYGREFADKVAGFDPAKYLEGFYFYTDEDRRFRFVRDKILGQTRYFEVMDSLIAADTSFSVADACKSLWMTDDQLGELDQRGHVIGLHSYSHPTEMASLSREAQMDQFSRNHQHLTRVMGKSPFAMSHPCNSYNADTIEVLEDLGVEIGFRANLEPSGGGRFEFPRDDHSHITKQMGLR